jgi:hypothetical protein
MKAPRFAILLSAVAGLSAAGIANAGNYNNDFSVGLNGITLTQSGDPPAASINAGSLRLTDAINSQQNSAYVPDLDPGMAVQTVRAAMMFSTAAGTCCGPTPPNGPADGVAIAFGQHSGAGTFGEEGPGGFNGLVISLDLWDNGDDEVAPSIDVKVNDVLVAGGSNTTVSPFTAGQFQLLEMFIDNNGTLDLRLGGQDVFVDLPTGFVPEVGDRFAFGARTGGANAVQRIDDLAIATIVPEPASLTVLGGVMTGLLVRRRNGRRWRPSHHAQRMLSPSCWQETLAFSQR